uniref:SPX domain-containing protein n=1 Tax=Eucampia antarctica TaxID=49252 RepID=A0A7S2VY37_9STRA
MKFGKSLREAILKEWRFYSVDYKEMKKILKLNEPISVEDSESEHDVDKSLGDDCADKFFLSFDASKLKVEKFYYGKEAWAIEYMRVLEERVEALRETTSNPPSPESENTIASLPRSTSSILPIPENENIERIPNVPKYCPTMSDRHTIVKKSSSSSIWLKDEYKRVAGSKHFHNFIYAKKSLCTFERELDLLLDFLNFNSIAFSKILKKFDKRTGSMMKEEKLAELRETHSFLDGSTLSQLRDNVSSLIDEVNSLKPCLPIGWEERKVYTIGCFDLFHRGHQNVLMSLREFGYYIVAGIHCDESYFKLKNKYTIDNLETRMNNVKPFVDQLFVIPSTDPTPFLKCMVSEQDIDTGSCCYARGDDMKLFPGREWCDTVMPVHFVPRTESCSSTLIRTIYHADCPELRKKAAFAKTRYDGKPVDDEGNILKLKPATSCPAAMHSITASS